MFDGRSRCVIHSSEKQIAVKHSFGHSFLDSLERQNMEETIQVQAPLEQLIDDVELVTRPSQSTQFFIFNLFGDYILERGGRIWTNDLLSLLALLGVHERAARTTLSRMKGQGWFDTVRDGRQSQYVITERGEAILRQGEKRIFEPALRDWNGLWHLAVYSIPEELRRERHELRKKLSWFGFGMLAPGTWVSPHDRRDEMNGLLGELAIDSYVTMFTAETGESAEIVRRCWDLDGLAADYELFIERHKPDYDAYRQGELTPSVEDCFVRRFWLTYNFQRFPLQDPNLPVELLPSDWPGHEARAIFSDYRRLLADCMSDFMDRMVAADG